MVTTVRILARNVRRLRDALGLSQEALAAKAKVGPASIKRIELERGAVGIDMLDSIAPALGVTPADLLTPPREIPADLARLIEHWVAGERLRPRVEPPVTDDEIAWLRSVHEILSYLPQTERTLEALVRAHRSRNGGL